MHKDKHNPALFLAGALICVLPCMVAFITRGSLRLPIYYRRLHSIPGATTAAQSVASSPQAEQTFSRVFQGPDVRPIVLFDGICVFCNRGVDTILKLDINRKLRFAPLQSQLGRDLMQACGRDPDDLSSMLLVEADRRLWLKSNAALRIAEIASPIPLLGTALERTASLLIPHGLRDKAYDQIAENRYSIFGKRDSCRLPDPGDDRFLA